MSDRLNMPSAVEMEQNLLGACVLEPAVIPQAFAIVTPEMWYRDRHRTMAEALSVMFHNNRPVDPSTLTQYLNDHDAAPESAGWCSYTTHVFRATPSPANWRYYAEIVYATAQRRAIIAAAINVQKRAELEEDPAQLYQPMTEMLQYTRPLSGPLYNRVEDLAGDRQALRTPGMRHIVPTRIGTIDRTLPGGGLYGGALVIVGGPTSMLKTTFALQMSFNIGLDQASPVLYCSCEMDRHEIYQRLRAQVSGVPYVELENQPEKYAAEIDSADHMLEVCNLYIEPAPGLTSQRVRSLVDRVNPCAVVIDHLQLMRLEERRGESKASAIGRVTWELKTLGMEKNMPVVLLSQLNRAWEQTQKRKPRPPRLCDLRESGDIEQNANVVMLVFWPYFFGAGNANELEVTFAKNRGGARKIVRLACDAPCCRITDPKGEEERSWETNS